MSGHGTCVVVLFGCEEMRRRVGPYAWVVLEHLAARCDPASSDAAVCTSTRDIAGQLGLSKDTVTRALRRLLEERLVSRAVDRDVTGQFGRATYCVDLERAGLRLLEAAAAFSVARDPSLSVTGSAERPTPPASKQERRRSSPARTDEAQLSLLDALDPPQS